MNLGSNEAVVLTAAVPEIATIAKTRLGLKLIILFYYEKRILRRKSTRTKYIEEFERNTKPTVFKNHTFIRLVKVCNNFSMKNNKNTCEST